MTKAATLIVGPSWIGDMVMTQSLLMLLKQREPEREIDVLAPNWSLHVVERMPQVRAAIPTGTNHGQLALARRRALGEKLQGHYERAIVLPRSFKSALIPWFAKIATRTGFRGEFRYLLINDMRPFDPTALNQLVERYVTLGLNRDEPIPRALFPSLTVSAEKQISVMKALDLTTDQPVVAMMPGAEYGPSKCWSLEEFSKVSQGLADEGFDVWILGSEKDRADAEVIASASRARNLCGKTSLADVIDLLGYAEHAVSNDSGLMHIAAAVGTITHAIYGSSSPTYTPPLTDKRYTYWMQLECSPCFERRCPLRRQLCLEGITAADILANIVTGSRYSEKYSSSLATTSAT